MAECITSRDNAKIKYACKLAQSAAFRNQEKSFLAEGLKLCPELAKGCPLKVIYYTEKALAKSPELESLPGEHYLVQPHVAEKLAQVDSSQGVFAVFGMPEPGWETVASVSAQKQGGARFLALERVQDPGNVGTLIRSAAAFGFDAVLLSDGCASPWSPKTLRSSMGAAARIPVLEVGSMAQAVQKLRNLGVLVLAAALYNSVELGAQPVQPGPGGLCTVIGSEGQGLSEETVRACSKAVRIPMSDRVESLNAGVAGSVLLWQFRGEC